MSLLLIDGCEVVVTMDDAGTEIAGGSILLESAEGRGTTARIVLPLVAEGLAPAASREAVAG